MNITAFSMTPLYKDRVMGGAQKQLYSIMMYLAEQGHQITILCTLHEPDAVQPFHWHENAEVRPIFRFKQPFPEPYATPIFNIANAIQDIGEYLERSDVFYSHDGGFIFPYVYQTIPMVGSLRSVIFSETLQSAYLFQGDDLILISNHQHDTILNTVGRFFPILKERTHVIYNGLNFDVFKPTNPNEVLKLIPEVDPDQHAITLYPHRPEAPKGIFEVIETANLLVHEHGIDNLRVLVPRWIESALSPDDKVFYEQLLGRIAAYSLQENFVFHQWMPQSLMPAYYSLGHVTFAIGSYVETFGNVPYESMACGTPAIVAKVGPARELLPDALIAKVNFGDIEQTAAIATQIIRNKTRTQPETIDYLKTHFQLDDMVKKYADVILNAKKRTTMPYVYHPIDEKTRFMLAPWIYHTDDNRYYHDFSAEYRQLDIEQSENKNSPEIMALYRDGFMVPLSEKDIE